MATQRAGGPVVAPSLGLYLDRPALLVPERGVQAPSKNFRISMKRIVSDSLGWGNFPDDAHALNLDGRPVLLIEQFTPRSGVTQTIMANTTDLFRFDSSTNLATYLTPRYQTGTVSITSGTPNLVGVGTLWLTNVKAGDYISVGAIDTISRSATWYKVLNVLTDTTLTLTTNYAAVSAVTAAYTARKTFTGSIANPFYTEIFFAGTALTSGADGDRWYATNNLDKIVAWDGVTNQVYYPTLSGGALTTCAFLRRFKNVMFYIAPVVSGSILSYAVRTSAIGQPENLSTLEASQFVVTDGTDKLLSAHQIGEQLALYSERTITLAQYVGTPIMYAFRTAVTDKGIVSPRAVAKFSDKHLLIGRDGMYNFDGITARPFNTHVWRTVAATLSPQRTSMIISHFDDSRGDLLWVTPLNSDASTDTGPPENAYTTHYLENIDEDIPFQAHSFRELPATALGYYKRLSTLTFDQLTLTWQDYNIRWNDQFLQATFPYTLFGDNNGNVFILNAQSTKVGTPLAVTVRHSRRPVIDNRTRGVVRRVYPSIVNQPGATHSVYARVRAYDSESGDVELVEEQNYYVDDAIQVNGFSPFRIPGRFMEIEFATTAAASPFVLEGYSVDAAKGGRR